MDLKNIINSFENVISNYKTQIEVLQKHLKQVTTLRDEVKKLEAQKSQLPFSDNKPLVHDYMAGCLCNSCQTVAFEKYLESKNKPYIDKEAFEKDRKPHPILCVCDICFPRL